MPSVSRPAEMDATDAASLAISTGSRVGSSRMLVSSSIRSVTAAAAAREISESWFGNATRSMVASVVNPRRSAAAAHVGIRVPGKWGAGLGKPMPIFMNVNLLVKDPAGKATTVELQRLLAHFATIATFASDDQLQAQGERQRRDAPDQEPGQLHRRRPGPEIGHQAVELHGLGGGAQPQVGQHTDRGEGE